MIDPVTGISDREKHEEAIAALWLAVQLLDKRLRKLENKKAPRGGTKTPKNKN